MPSAARVLAVWRRFIGQSHGRPPAHHHSDQPLLREGPLGARARHLPYREERHLQVIHWAHIWRAGRGWTAPVLVTPKGPLRESAQIVRFADAHAHLGLYRNPLAAALEARFDAHLGPDARTWMYHRMLEPPGPDGGVRRARRPALGARRAADDAAADAQADRRAAPTPTTSTPPPRATACGRSSTRSPPASATAAPTCAATPSAPPTSRSPRSPPPCSSPTATASRCRRSTSCPAPYGDEVQAMREHPAGRFALRLYDQERP